MPKVGVIRGGNLYVEKDKQQYCSVEYANLHKSNLIDNNFTIVVLRDLVPSGPNIGLMVRITSTSKYLLAQGVYGFKVKENVSPDFLIHISNTDDYRKVMRNIMVGSTQVHITNSAFKKVQIPLPPTIEEQKAIATALNDTDELISKLEKLIAKKRAIKQGTMQELLKPKEGWVIRTLDELIICMDNLRVPLNENQRFLMKGDYPYCGANGVLDFINEYRIDDEVILIAEDGGYFDEYAYRPIAYIMKGKFWVNNHAHILKAQSNYDQHFIFYSLVHKNIQNYLASGTRAKLNKSEMYKIEINIPEQKSEQTRISHIFTDMDLEIESLEKKLEKLKLIKQGMMQNLLTGKIRLV